MPEPNQGVPKAVPKLSPADQKAFNEAIPQLSAEDWKAFQAEFQRESDRSVAVLGATLLDTQLEKLLTYFLIDDEREVRRLLKQPFAPFSSFDARIKATFVLGLISKEEYHDLDVIRSVRNKFAHRLHGVTFNDTFIKDLCLKLRIPPRTPRLIAAVKVEGSPRGYFMWSTLVLTSILDLRMFNAKRERRQTPPEAEVSEGSADHHEEP